MNRLSLKIEYNIKFSSVKRSDDDPARVRPRITFHLDSCFKHTPVSYFMRDVKQTKRSGEIVVLDVKDSAKLTFGEIDIDYDSPYIKRYLSDVSRKPVPKDSRLMVFFHSGEISRIFTPEEDIGVMCTVTFSMASFELWELFDANDKYLKGVGTESSRWIERKVVGNENTEFGSIRVSIDNSSMPSWYPSLIQQLSVPKTLNYGSIRDLVDVNRESVSVCGFVFKDGFGWVDLNKMIYGEQPTEKSSFSKKKTNESFFSRALGSIVDKLSQTNGLDSYKKEWSSDKESRQRKEEDDQIVLNYSESVNKWITEHFNYVDTGVSWLQCEYDYEMIERKIATSFFLQRPAESNALYFANRFYSACRRHFLHTQKHGIIEQLDMQRTVDTFRKLSQRERLVVLSYMLTQRTTSQTYKSDQVRNKNGVVIDTEDFAMSSTDDDGYDCEDLDKLIEQEVVSFLACKEITDYVITDPGENTLQSAMKEMQMLASCYIPLGALSLVLTSNIIKNSKILTDNDLNEHMSVIMEDMKFFCSRIRVFKSQVNENATTANNLKMAIKEKIANYDLTRNELFEMWPSVYPHEPKMPFMAFEGTGMAHPFNDKNPLSKMYNNALVDSEVIPYVSEMVYHPTDAKRTFYLNIGRVFTSAFVYDSMVPVGDFVLSYSSTKSLEIEERGSYNRLNYSVKYEDYEADKSDIVFVATPFLSKLQQHHLYVHSKFTKQVDKSIMREDYRDFALTRSDPIDVTDHESTLRLFSNNEIVYDHYERDTNDEESTEYNHKRKHLRYIVQKKSTQETPDNGLVIYVPGTKDMMCVTDLLAEKMTIDRYKLRKTIDVLMEDWQNAPELLKGAFIVNGNRDPFELVNIARSNVLELSATSSENNGPQIWVNYLSHSTGDVVLRGGSRVLTYQMNPEHIANKQILDLIHAWLSSLSVQIAHFIFEPFGTKCTRVMLCITL